jgi:ribosomal protein S18 acetylase RimI-like enzyme
VTRVRAANASDTVFLEEMLFEACDWDPAAPRPSFATFRSQPEYRQLLGGWGRPGDRALVAEEQAARLGAAWFRLWTRELHSYGFVDASVPELGIAVSRVHRRTGVGRLLLRALLDAARNDGFSAVSLSVSPANPARLLYESEGFLKVGESGTSWTFLLRLDRAPEVARFPDRS